MSTQNYPAPPASNGDGTRADYEEFQPTRMVTVVEVRRSFLPNSGWSVVFDYEQPTDSCDYRTRYHGAHYPDPRGKGPAPAPFHVGEQVNVEEI